MTFMDFSAVHKRSVVETSQRDPGDRKHETARAPLPLSASLLRFFDQTIDVGKAALIDLAVLKCCTAL